MDYLNLLLIAIIIYIGYLLSNETIISNQPKISIPPKKVEKFKSIKTKQQHKPNDILVDDILDNLQEWDKNYTNRSKIKKHTIKPNFINTLFHDDYRDVITAFNNIVPSNKQLFNIANVPLKYSEPNKREVKSLVINFINDLNSYIKKDVNLVRDLNTGWDEPLEDPNVESGWDRVQANLGLSTSLYNKPLKQTGVELISLERVQKYETEDEIKYACNIIIEKTGSNEQMIFKISFIINKNLLHDENRFFSAQNVDLDVAIEEIHIEGYLSDNGDDANKLYKNIKEKHYEINNMEFNSSVSPALIKQKLMEHHNKKEKEMNYRNSLLDTEGRDFHRNLPSPSDYASYQVTQTVFDDMNCKKKN